MSANRFDKRDDKRDEVEEALFYITMFLFAFEWFLLFC